MAKTKKGKAVKSPKKAVKKSAVKKPGLFSRLLGKKKPAPKAAKKSVKKVVKKPAPVKKAVKTVKKPISKPVPKPAPKKPEKLAALKKIAKEPIRKEEPVIIEEEDLGPVYEPVPFKARPIHLKEDKILTAEGWLRLFEMGLVHVKKDI